MVIKSCPKCGNIYDSSDSKGIGKPFLICSDCQCLIIDTDITEWDLKSGIGKLGYILICGWTSLCYGIAVPLAAAFGLAKLFGFEISDISLLIYLCVVGVLCFLVLIYFRNSTDIRESKERMKDPHYRDFLIRIGLLRESNRAAANSFNRSAG
jgi:hypothetical protein